MFPNDFLKLACGFVDQLVIDVNLTRSLAMTGVFAYRTANIVFDMQKKENGIDRTVNSAERKHNLDTVYYKIA